MAIDTRTQDRSAPAYVPTEVIADNALAVVRRAWEIRLAHGLESALRGAWADDCLFEDPPGFPEPRVHTGRGGVRGALERMNAFWDEFTIEPAQLLQRGDAVIAICWVRGKPRGNPITFKVETAYVYEVKGNRITRCRSFTTSEEAIEAVRP